MIARVTAIHPIFLAAGYCGSTRSHVTRAGARSNVAFAVIHLAAVLGPSPGAEIRRIEELPLGGRTDPVHCAGTDLAAGGKLASNTFQEIMADVDIKRPSGRENLIELAVGKP